MGEIERLRDILKLNLSFNKNDEIELFRKIFNALNEFYGINTQYSRVLGIDVVLYLN